MKVIDGEGSSRAAGVTTDHRLKTEAVEKTEIHYNSITDEEVYMFSTAGFVTISSTGTETGVFYLQNTSATKNLILNNIRTCGNQIQKVLIYTNPTGGTLISTANAASSINFNLVSSNTSDSIQYYGANGHTVSGGTHATNHINNIGHSTMDLSNAVVLGRNDSIAITFELAVAGDVCVSVIGYYE